MISEMDAKTILDSRSGFSSGKLNPNSLKFFSKVEALGVKNFARNLGCGFAVWGYYSTEQQFEEGLIQSN